MKTINVKRFGIACGLMGVGMYVGFLLSVLIIGYDQTTIFLNGIFRGLDMSTLFSSDIQGWKAGFGIAQAFIISWIFGTLVSVFQNVLRKQ